MFKLVTVLALVATASAAPQTINYGLPGGQAAFNLGAPSSASATVAQAVGSPRFGGFDTIHVVSANSPTENVWITTAPVLKPSSWSAQPSNNLPAFPNSGSIILIPVGSNSGSFYPFQPVFKSGSVYPLSAVINAASLRGQNIVAVRQ